MSTNIIRHSLALILLTLSAALPLAATGCEEEAIPTTTQTANTTLSSTLVPNTDLDIYLYARQESPTTVPKDLTGTTADVAIESLALWGIAMSDKLIFSGRLALAGGADPAGILTQIPAQAETWTSSAGSNIYFVQGTGAVADTLKTAISQNDFKNYDDREALTEVALLPDGRTTKLAAVAIVKLTEKMRHLIVSNTTPEYAGMAETLLSWANLHVITAGLYTPRQIAVTEIVQGIEQGNIWAMEIGILASIKSGLPGFVVSSIVENVLKNNGYIKTTLGNITVYKGSIDTGYDQPLAALVRIEGNRIYAAISSQESYAETLIQGVNID